MRNPLILATAMLCVGGLALAPRAQAQGSPSADQIINSLKPTGPLSGGTRGIRPVAPHVTAPAPRATPATMRAGVPAHPAPRPVPAPAGVKPASVSLTVEFRTGSAELTPAAMGTLDQLGKALTSATLSAYRFRIEGHTDTVGSAAANQSLSDQRAAAVAKYLEGKFNVTAKRLETVGMGEQGLMVQTPPQTPEPRNRRVQVINLGA